MERCKLVEAAAESHLRQIDFREAHYKYSVFDLAYWLESRRVLRPGGCRVMIDYDYSSVAAKRTALPLVMDFALLAAYQHDITRSN